MALSRFVLTSTVVLPPDAVPTATAGEPGTGGAAGFGNAAGTDAAGHWGITGATFTKGMVIYADSSGAGGAGALYTAIGASNLRAYVQGTDDRGPSGVSN